jgi:glutamate dehydrogenase/leucine dehydrogenase
MNAVIGEVEKFMKSLRARTPGESEFHQAVHEVVESVMPLVLDNAAYRDARVLERLTEPDRVIMFRVTWQDDAGEVRVNRAYRVQFSNAIGPYKGGMRFHPSVNLAILKFLGFEQVFKNSLTTLPLGGGKGGADFDPKGKSDGEVMRFCQSLMTELCRHVGPQIDIPAGDIGVGAREIGYLYGQYKRVRNEHTGVLTGKGLAYGGSLIRPQATGYGLVYLSAEALAHKGDGLQGKTVAISGSGNVAQYATEKATELGAKVVTLSDSGGFIHDPAGIDAEKLAYVMDLKNVQRGRIRAYAERFGCTYEEGRRPWSVTCDIALPCATQNEIELADADALIANGVSVVGEGANMPTDPQALARFRDAGVLFLPGKAANAGGVACSGLEMAQNAQHMVWTPEEVDNRLKGIMANIHGQCVEHGGTSGGAVDYVNGANAGGFVKVADALVSYGVV